MKSLLLILTLLFALNLSAQEGSEDMILLEYPALNVPDKKFYLDQINKLTIQTILKHKGYQLFYSNDGLPKNGTRLNKLLVNVAESTLRDHYKIVITQNSGKTGKTIKESWAVNIPRRFILLQIRIGLVEALYGKDLAAEEKKRLRKQDEAFSEFLEKTEKKDKVTNDKSVNRDGPTDESSKKKDKNPKGGTSGSSMTEPGVDTPVTSLDSPLSFEEIEEKIIASNYRESLQKQKNALSGDIASVEQTQNEIRTSLEQAGRSGKSESDSTDNKSSPNKENAGVTTVAQTAISQQAVTGNINPFNKATRPRTTRTIFDFVYLNRTLETNYIIKVNNNLNFAGPRVTHRVNLSETAGDDLVFSVMNLKALETNEVSFKVPDIRNAHFQYLNTFPSLPFDMIFGLHYENFFFINLPELNEGLQLAENHLVWAQIGFERAYNFRYGIIALQALGAKNIYSRSNFKKGTDIKLDATRLNLGADVIFGKWRMGTHYSRESVASENLKDFKLEQTSYYLNLAYAF